MLAMLVYIHPLSRQIFKQITTSVVVHKEGLRTLRELSSQKPLILIPSHRSYLDFIIVTWLLYSFDIKTPVIAAGQVLYSLLHLYHSTTSPHLPSPPLKFWTETNYVSPNF